jgi:hypothetical protein
MNYVTNMAELQTAVVTHQLVVADCLGRLWQKNPKPPGVKVLSLGQLAQTQYKNGRTSKYMIQFKGEKPCFGQGLKMRTLTVEIGKFRVIVRG